jgi:DNA-binding transcriptional ArsR family regulator
MNTPLQPDPERLISDLDALKAYFDPVRFRIVQAVAAQPRTVHEIAAELGVPFTRLYYHMNLLEKHGIIRVAETRTLSGAVEEKTYQITAYMFVIDRRLLEVQPGDETSDALELVMDTVFEETRRDIRRSVRSGKIDMRELPPHPSSLLNRRGLFKLSRTQAEEFYRRIQDMIVEFTAAPCDDDCEYYGLAVSFYPTAFAESAGQDSEDV